MWVGADDVEVKSFSNVITVPSKCCWQEVMAQMVQSPPHRLPSPSAPSFRYRDEEGDWCTITGEDDWAEAVAMCCDGRITVSQQERSVCAPRVLCYLICSNEVCAEFPYVCSGAGDGIW